MEMTGEYRIPAPRQKVWEALNDVDVLARCIPGCQSMERCGGNDIEAVVIAKVGPVKAKFKGAVTLSELDPPASYVISGEGKGGAAGFAKGGARVSLAEDGEATVLSYEVKATVGGKLMQVGSRLIDSVAKKMADEFFAAFVEIVAGEAMPDPGEAAEPEATAAETPSGGLSPWVWVPGLIALVALGLYYFGVVN